MDALESALRRARLQARIKSDQAEEKVASLDLACGILLFPFAIALQGWVLQCLWSWFILPATGYATPSVAVCAGLMLITRFATTGTGSRGGTTLVTTQVVCGMLGGLFVLAVGFAIQLFV